MNPSFKFPPPPPPPPKASSQSPFPWSRGPGRGRGDRSNVKGSNNSQQGRGRPSNRGALGRGHGRGWGRGVSNGHNDQAEQTQRLKSKPSAGGDHNVQANLSSAAQGLNEPRKRSLEQASANITSPYSPTLSKKQKVEAPPSVPSFGIPLPQLPPPKPANQASACMKPPQSKSKHKTNLLGLTPTGDDYSDSDPEVVEDEEAAHCVDVESKGPMAIEYRGRVSVLKSAADIAAWIAERKKNWPTKERIEAKKAEEAKHVVERVRFRQEDGENGRKDHAAKMSQRKLKGHSGPRGPDGQESRSRPGNEACGARNSDQGVKKAAARHRASDANASAQGPQIRGSRRASPSLVSVGVFESDALVAKTVKMETKMKKLQERLTKSPRLAAIHCTTDDDQHCQPPLISSRPSQHSANGDMDSDLESELSSAITTSSSSVLSSSTSSSRVSSVDLESNEDSITELTTDAVLNFDPLPVDSPSSRNSSPEELRIERPPEASPEGNDPSFPVDGAPPEEDSTGASGRDHSTQSSIPCKYFARNGRCRYGTRCRHAHIPPPTKASQPGKKPSTGPNRGTGRLSLYQRLVAQQEREEMERVVRVVEFLGAQGFFGNDHNPASDK